MIFQVRGFSPRTLLADMAVLLNLRRSTHFLSAPEVSSPPAFVHRLLGKSEVVEQAFHDLKKSTVLAERKSTLARLIPKDFWGTRTEMAEALYLVCRTAKPLTVVETGVYHGLSSAFILQALQDNGKGELYSIDRRDRVPQGYPTGWLVSESLKPYWHLVLGNSRIVLPILLRQLKSIDIFLHDSDHAYETMIFEYETSWKYLKDGGVLLSDDVDYSVAFSEFALKTGCSNIALGLFPRSVFGGILKA